MIEIESKIKQSPSLVKFAKDAGKDKKVQRNLNNLVEQLRLGNTSPGTWTKTLFKNIKEAPTRGGARVYFRKKNVNKKISFPSSLKYIEDIYDDNMDVFVELEDGS